MATYNGAEYLREQLDSILAQLRPDDEVVVVDDASTDDTVALLESYHDARVKVFRNPQNLGYVRSFERALTLADGDVLLLSDQDDVWVPGRRDALADAAAESGVAASNLLLLGTGTPLRSPLTGRPWLLHGGAEHRPLRTELRILAGDAPYFGCAMAIRRDALALLTPFPDYLSESHDLWIATAANRAGKLTHVDQATVLRRVHDSNASTSRPRGVAAAVRSRLLLVRLWREAGRRLAATRGLG
jgi:glycosyltransferase involved in cell wall biosynthesis